MIKLFIITIAALGLATNKVDYPSDVNVFLSQNIELSCKKGGYQVPFNSNLRTSFFQAYRLFGRTFPDETVELYYTETWVPRNRNPRPLNSSPIKPHVKKVISFLELENVIRTLNNIK